MYHENFMTICSESAFRAGHECGAISGNVVMVVVGKPRRKADLQPYHPPGRLYLNSACMDTNGYDIEQNNLVAL
jgi:hypothetical protein